MKKHDWVFLITVFMVGLVFVQMAYTNEKLEIDLAAERAKPCIVYQVDNAGGETAIGTVTAKKIDGNKYSVAVNGYGWFVVTREQFEAIVVGADAPEYLKERGN